MRADNLRLIFSTKEILILPVSKHCHKDNNIYDRAKVIMQYFSQLLNCIAEIWLHAIETQRDFESEVAIPQLIDKGKQLQWREHDHSLKTVFCNMETSILLDMNLSMFWNPSRGLNCRAALPIYKNRVVFFIVNMDYYPIWSITVVCTAAT